MPYIAYDLDAIAKAQHAARAARVGEDVIHGGNLRMWEFCWRSGVDHLSALQVRGFYATDSDVMPGLVAFGFLEPDGDAFRVKGAERYLRVSEARSRGGHAAKGNLVPGARQKKTVSAPPEIPSAHSARAESQPRASREPAEKVSGLPLGSSSALSASSEQRVFKKDLSAEPTPNPPVPQKAESAETERPSPQEQTRPGWKDLIAGLGEDFERALGSKWEFEAGRDGSALKALRKTHSDEEIRQRWRDGLRLDQYTRVTNLGQLRSQWGRVVAATVKPKSTPAKPGGSTWLIPKG